MNSQRIALLLMAMLLTGSAGHGLDSGPEPLARIDLRPMGYQPSAQTGYNIALVKWWKQYVVIDSIFVICGKCGPDSTYNYQPARRLVIDSSSGKAAPVEAVADAMLEPNPQDFDWKHEHPKTADGEVVAKWRGMALVRGHNHRDLWLEEPGQEKKLIFSHQYFESAAFVAPDRILIIGRIQDKPDCSICHVHLRVVDKSGELKYQLPAGLNPGLFDYYALNRDGTRFAVRDNIESGRDTVADTLTLGQSTGFLLNTGIVKVYEAADGQKVFEYRWRVEKYEHDCFGRVALSDDGSLLAVIQNHDLLVFRLPAAAASYK